MGYLTNFSGKFFLNKPLDDVTFNFLKKLSETRRMSRRIDVQYGVEGEFYVDGTGFRGQDIDSTVIDHNREPKTQPSLWCHWMPTDDRLHIEWDGGEKFYGYIEWIEYLISKVLAPRGYVVNGDVAWRGEDFDDTGVIEVNDNMVNGKRLIVDYSINKLLGAIGASTSGGRNTTPSVSMNKRSSGIRPDGTKTKHQIYKEKQEAAEQALKDQIAELEKQLKEKDKLIAEKKAEETKVKKMTVQDLMLEKIRKSAEFGGTLDEFKTLLKNLMGES
jgi:hypothetical protein